MSRVRDIVIIDDSQLYRRCRVQLRGAGAVLRDQVPGSSIRTKRQQVCRAGQLLVAEIDAKLGGVAIVPTALDGAIVSTHYFLFDLNPARLDQRFLSWFLRTERFQSQVRAQGSTNYAAVRPAHVLGYEIPLPPLIEQVRIADRLDRISAATSEIAVRMRASADALGQILAQEFEHSARGAPRRPMSAAAPLVRRSVGIRSSESYPELGIRSFGRGTFHKPPLDASEVGSKRLFRIAKGDLVFSNVFAWEGAVAVAGPEDDGRFGSHRFMTCVPEHGQSVAEFLAYYFQTDEGLTALRSASPGGAGRNRTLGVEALARIRVPSPEVDVQLRFVELVRLRDEVRRRAAASQAACESLANLVAERAFVAPGG
jgi:type I restriction enzyme S subunit